MCETIECKLFNEDDLRRWAPYVHGVARRMLPNHADDVTQDALIALWRARSRLIPGRDPRPYIVRIVSNTVADYATSSAARHEFSWGDTHAGVEGPDPSVVVMEDIQKSAAQGAIARLVSLREYRIMLLQAQGHTYAEIGARLDMSVGAVKLALFRARKRVRDAVKKRSPQSRGK
jgi:RNA polymerase sigma factor (sigma-70 family)